MLPVHSILHPTDFSEHSDAAFRLACVVARDCGARLFLMHVQRQPVVIPFEGVVPPEPERVEEELGAKLQNLQAMAPGIQVESRLVMSADPAAEILRMAAEKKCDLIILGTHGRTGLGRLLMGSVAEQVVRKAACPVLTVKIRLREQ